MEFRVAVAKARRGARVATACLAAAFAAGDLAEAARGAIERVAAICTAPDRPPDAGIGLIRTSSCCDGGPWEPLGLESDIGLASEPGQWSGDASAWTPAGN